MRILALDLATKTGWAYWNGSRIESGVQTFALERGESQGMRWIRFNRWLDEFLSAHPLDVVVYEQNFRRGGHASEVAAGFTTRVHEFCARCQAEHASVNVSTLKKWALGSGRAEKADMVQEAMRRWKTTLEDDNEADALWVLAWAQQQFDRPMRSTVGMDR